MAWDKEKLKKEGKSFLIIVNIVFAFRSVFFEPFKIPTGSMIPTLNIGDFILVNKFAYGFKVPFSDMFSDPIYITDFVEPKRGDVIVFKYPKDESLNFIKRLIGVPGDKREIYNKQVFVNGKQIITVEMTEKKSKELSDEMVDHYKKITFKFMNAKIDDKEFMQQYTYYQTPHDTMDEFTVPEGQYFVMGDNRDFSSDSRVWGFVPRQNIRGKAILIWFSLNLPIFGDHSFRFRPYRGGTRIH